jgi:Lar family restriction alleviation protein
MTPVSPETMARELLPCPFCGGAASISKHRDESLWSHDIVWWAQITCDECETAGPYECEDDDAAKAIAAWNRRAGYSAALAEVKALRDAAQFLIDVRDGRSTAEYLGDKTEAAIRMIRAALVQLRTANGEKK